jgi:ribosomal protein S6--L-glutamate ligase
MSIKRKKLLKNKVLVGWREWVALPHLGLPAIRAKIDSGAKTSSLHAFNIKIIKKGEKRYAKFDIHPLHNHKNITVTCRAPLVDRRFVTDSGGHREKRYVINTAILIGNKLHDIEVTLADRETMAFRMLLGRQAMQIANIAVLPAKSHLLGKMIEDEVLDLYEDYFHVRGSE